MEQISKTKAWILASRPKTLLAAVVPVLTGSALAIKDGKFYIELSLLALFCSILIQIGTNFTNDLFDYLKGADTAERKGPLRVLAAGLISVKEMKAGIAIVFLTSFIAGLYIVFRTDVYILIIGVLSILAGMAYTAGPYPLAYNGLGDIFVFIFFGIIGTAGTYYLHTSEITRNILLCSLPPALLITNILVVNNYRDINEDKTANKRTLAVILGPNFALAQFIFSILFSYMVPFILYIFYGFSLWVMLPIFSLPIALKIILLVITAEGKELNKGLELSAKLSAIFGLLFSAGIIL